MRRHALSSAWDQPVWQWLASRAHRLRHWIVMAAYHERAAAFVGGSLRRMQVAVVKSLTWRRTLTALLGQTCNGRPEPAAFFCRSG